MEEPRWKIIVRKLRFTGAQAPPLDLRIFRLLQYNKKFIKIYLKGKGLPVAVMSHMLFRPLPPSPFPLPAARPTARK